MSLLIRRTIAAPPRSRCTSRIPFSSQTSSSPPPLSHKFKFARTLSLAATLSLTTYTIGAIFPPSTLTLLYPRPSPPLPDPSTPEAEAYTASLERTLQTLPLLQTMRAAPDSDDWYECRPYDKFPEEKRVHSFSAGTLRGPGKLALKPFVRAKRDESESVVIVHVGRNVCGHDGIVHGGLLATLSDEVLGRIAIHNLPEKVGVTATLTMNYRAPTRADQFIIFRTHVVETQGRKVRVAGQIEDLKGTVLAEANATFVQPKYAKLLDTQHLKAALGSPEPKDAPSPLRLANGGKADKR